MSFLRVAAFDMEASVDVWESTMGQWLSNNADCIAATAASDGGTWLVVSEWTSREAYEADLASPGFREVFENAASKLGFSADEVKPSFLFEGDVAARA